MLNTPQHPYGHLRQSRKILSSLSRSHRILAAKPPKYLHHYTGSAGVMGIVDSSSIFLSDASFLNDQSEITYARALIAGVLAEMASSEREYHRRLLMAAVRRMSNTSEAAADMRYYVACFCENGNLLSQWRAYGRPGCGYSMGFLSSHLDGLMSSGDEASAALRKVVYGRDVQERIVKRAVRIWQKTLPETATGDQPSAELSAACVTALVLALYSVAPQFKHPLFKEEREWRLVSVSYGNPESLRFRQSGTTIVPYITVDITSRSGPHAGRIPLEQITHAPTSDPDLQKRALLEILRARKYPDSQVTIQGSDIPLRSA